MHEIIKFFFERFIRIVVGLSIAVAPVHCLFSQEWRQIENKAFAVGEKLHYRFYYDAWLTGKVTAGTGVMEVKEADITFNGRPVYHIDADGQSKGMFNWF